MIGKKLKIGITCYPSIGGSGIVATELGAELARRGHEVHFICYEQPFRLNTRQARIYFHTVEFNEYKLFKYPDYTLPLAVKMRAVSIKHDLDILHVHYAVPHATAALLSKLMDRRSLFAGPRVITTLHGTDITLVGSDPKLYPIVKYSIEQSCGVTAVSENLKRTTLRKFSLHKNITVIYNFYTPKKPHYTRETMRARMKIHHNEVAAVHLSNMRPVKRIDNLLKITAEINKEIPFKLILLAGGDFTPYMPLLKKLKIESKVIIQKNIRDIENYIPAADFGLFTSSYESFGMGILEVMSYGLPVIAPAVGGVPEVIDNKKTGFLFPVDDFRALVRGVRQLSQDVTLRSQMGAAARMHAQKYFSAEKIVSNYERYYYAILKKFKC